MESVLFNTPYPEFRQRQIVNTTYLYYLGDEFTDITGGWKYAWVDKNYRSGTVTKESNNIYFGDNSSGYGNPCIFTLNHIDKTGYVGIASCLSAEASGGSSSYPIRIGIGCGQNNEQDGSIKTNKIYWIIEQPSFSIPKSIKSGYIQFEDVSGNVQFISYTYSHYYGNHKVMEHMYAYAIYKRDDISGLSSYGADITSIIANATSLLADLSAVKYMITQCTGDFMWMALANSGFITALNASPNKNTILANAEWGKALQLIL